jgi:Xaa-Pro aminopeptidase
MVADSDRDANMLYAVGMFVPDPFIYLEHDGKPHIVLSDPEIDRAKTHARHCRVLSLDTYQQRLRRNGNKNPRLQDVIALLLKEKKIRKVEVPQTFPIGLARDLKEHGFKVRPRKEPVFPAREVKTSEEIKKISASLMMAEVGLAEGIHALRNSKIGAKNELMLHGSPLTTERLRGIINTATIQAGGIASHTIVSCGPQTCDPHEPGFGLLFAHQPIILDVTPRSQKTGYYGAIARTVVKGRAREALRALYHAVASAQETAVAQLTENRTGGEIHQAVSTYFDQRGYRTRRTPGRVQGFFHSVGNGIGLETQESPRLSANSQDTLSPNQVLTIAPGLYYPELGGARLKDLACITRTHLRNLTKFEKTLEL